MLRAYVSPYKDEDDDCGLDEVGPLAVLGAMVEQRKRSSSMPPPPSPQTATAADESGSHPRQPHPSDVDPIDLQDVFQKIR
jgi:hypothetical protein